MEMLKFMLFIYQFIYFCFFPPVVWVHFGRGCDQSFVKYDREHRVYSIIRFSGQLHSMW